MISPLFRVLAALVMAVVSVSAVAAEPPIIAKARARIAPDAVLDGIKSIHYVGTLTNLEPKEATEAPPQTIEIFLQKPAQQRIVVSSPAVIEISGLDAYEAWRRTIDAKDPTRWQQQQLNVEQIKQLRADVWQNLYFFRGIEALGGRVEDQGSVTIQGVACRKIAFHHSPTLIYYRYFNEATGELVFTGDERNNVREEGEMIADGIRFPKSVIITQVDAEGRSFVRRITFDKITVNESFDRDIFAVPLPTLK